MKLLLRATCLLAAAAGVAGAQPSVTIADVGPGAGGRILQEILRKPHRLVEPESAWFIIPRGQAERSSIVVLGRTAAISGKIDGDVIVVGGDLFVRPAAEISGRAVAIGGGVYPSTLSFIGGGRESFRDNTYDIERTTEGYRLTYRSLRADASRSLLFPLFYGFRVPSYDRVNGVSLPFGPTFRLAGGRAELEAIVTYRSDLGAIDPRIEGTLQLDRRSRVEVKAERGTLTNESWIWQDYVNSLSALALGIDTRNYYRADRATLSVFRVWEGAMTTVEPFLGGSAERTWEVGPSFGEQRGPWSALGRTDSLGMWRPNPAVPRASDAYVHAGAAFTWEPPDLRLTLRTRAEMPVGAQRASVVPGSTETISPLQFTSDLAVGFPTFGEQSYEIDVHWVTTAVDTANPQRWAYLGGSGTLPFLDLLEQGGDQLLLIDQRYSIPLLGVRLGFFGSPTLQLRHRLGSAGVGRLPSLEQMIGVGLSVTVVRGEIQLEPTSGKVRFSTGFTFSR